MNTGQPGRVVVGVSETVAGLRALRLAVAEARHRGSELHALRAYVVGAPVGIAMPEVRGYVTRLARDAVARAFDAIGGRPDDLQVVVVLREGERAWVLTQYAIRDDDLLVVGSSRRGIVRRLFHRSTAKYCAAHATCPVLVVPPDAFARRAHLTTRAIRRDVEQLAAIPRPPVTG